MRHKLTEEEYKQAVKIIMADGACKLKVTQTVASYEDYLDLIKTQPLLFDIVTTYYKTLRIH